jgi:hypothetical protein
MKSWKLGWNASHDAIWRRDMKDLPKITDPKVRKALEELIKAISESEKPAGATKPAPVEDKGPFD